MIRIIRVVGLLTLSFWIILMFALTSKAANPQIIHRDFQPIYDEFMRHCTLHRDIPGLVVRSDKIKVGDITWYLIVRYRVGYAVRTYIQKERWDEDELLGIIFDGMSREGIGAKWLWEGFCTLQRDDVSFKCEDSWDVWSDGIKLFKEKYRI